MLLASQHVSMCRSDMSGVDCATSGIAEGTNYTSHGWESFQKLIDDMRTMLDELWIGPRRLRH